jgi:hypothetical protein
MGTITTSDGTKIRQGRFRQWERSDEADVAPIVNPSGNGLPLARLGLCDSLREKQNWR